MSPTRPALRYYGGKWRLAPWVIAHFPPHRVYLEPYGGAASVLLRKPRAYAEIYNDLDDEVVGLFRVLQSPAQAARLIALLRVTPFARAEFDLAYADAAEPVECARRLVMRPFMGHGSTAISKRSRTGFRADSNRSGTTPALDWAHLPDALPALVERLAGVVIERRPALSLIDRFDGADTLIYADPPYVPSTRSRKVCRGRAHAAYEHELDEADHLALIERLRAVCGMVVLSGYPTALYDRALEGWRRVTCDARDDRARARTEALWINPAAAKALREQTPDLFEAAA